MWKSCEWKGQLISTQRLLYIMNAYWQNLKTSALGDAVLVNFNWMCWASKERRNEKLKGQLEKGRLPHVHRSVRFPTLDVILRERKPKKRNYKTSIFGNLEDSFGPRVWQALVIVNVSDVYVPAIVAREQAHLFGRVPKQVSTQTSEPTGRLQPSLNVFKKTFLRPICCSYKAPSRCL